jgi:CRP/FNR family transcriptional regulator, cyclic AMP receptor protein
VALDTSSFFIYPNVAAETTAPETFFADRDERDWDRLLAYTETRRFRPGEVVLPDGVADRALYLLADGRLEVHPGGQLVDAPATLCEESFLDGEPAAAGLRAVTHGEAQRLSFEAFETLSAREPRLARDLLLDLGRLVAAELRRLQAPDQG